MSTNSFSAVAVNAATANDRGAAFIDGDSRLSVAEYFGIENFPLAFLLDGDAEFLAVVDPALANQRVAVVADSYFREGMAEYLRFLHRAHAAVADQDPDVSPAVYLATTDDGIAPINDQHARASHGENVAILCQTAAALTSKNAESTMMDLTASENRVAAVRYQNPRGIGENLAIFQRSFPIHDR